ncbi:MAG: alanine racemase [Clostridia bacterium]|nr:alanine racemase [Clostridia bacterium]
MLDQNMTRAWAEISLDAIRDNFRIADAIAAAHGAKTMAVVKADAYGHGAKQIARTLQECGASYFAVATFMEALELVEAGVTASIVVLSEVHESLYGELVSHHKAGRAPTIIPSIFRLESARALSEAAAAHHTPVDCFLAVDTGMSRIGFECSTPEKRDASIDAIVKIASLPNLRCAGIFSHLARADETDKASALAQQARFDDFIARLHERGVDPPLRSLCNSAALVEKAFADKYDLVREGIILYGLQPSDEIENRLPIRPAMEVKARVTNIKTLPAGQGISYGHTYVTSRETRVATIPYGYADGYPRLLSNRAGVLIDGKFAPILGRVCMDQMMVDVTDIPSAHIDSVATIMGADERVRADRLAAIMGTIPYELICAVSQRVPRIYVNNL